MNSDAGAKVLNPNPQECLDDEAFKKVFLKLSDGVEIADVELSDDDLETIFIHTGKCNSCLGWLKNMIKKSFSSSPSHHTLLDEELASIHVSVPPEGGNRFGYQIIDRVDQAAPLHIQTRR